MIVVIERAVSDLLGLRLRRIHPFKLSPRSRLVTRDAKAFSADFHQ
jgi:hypothetical protein